MDRRLSSLSSDFRPLAVELLAQLTEAGIQVMIVQTARTMEEHRINLANGTSRTSLSKHLPRSLRGFNDLDRGGRPNPNADKADAIDLCPWDVYQVSGPDKLAWSENLNPQVAAAFQKMGEIGEALGLRWGGRWKDPHDPGHFEYVFPSPKADGLLAQDASGAGGQG